MLEKTVIYALLSGGGLALSAAPLGCILIWRCMAFYIDALTHAALLGVAIGVILQVGDNLGILLVCLLFTAVIVAIRRMSQHSAATVLGIAAHLMLALGIVLLNLFKLPEVDMHHFLLGNIMGSSTDDITMIYAVFLIVAVTLILNWRHLLLWILSEDIAKAESVPTLRVELTVFTLISLVIAVGVYLMGILLMSSLMIIPAAAARKLSNTPEQMVVFSIILAIVSVVAGITISIISELPAVPTIVLSCGAIFLATIVFATDKK